MQASSQRGSGMLFGPVAQPTNRPPAADGCASGTRPLPLQRS